MTEGAFLVAFPEKTCKLFDGKGEEEDGQEGDDPLKERLIRAKEAAPEHPREPDDRQMRKENDPGEISEADNGAIPVQQIGDDGLFRGDNEQENDFKRMEKHVFQEDRAVQGESGENGQEREVQHVQCPRRRLPDSGTEDVPGTEAESKVQRPVGRENIDEPFIVKLRKEMLCQQFGSHLDHKAGEEDRPRAEAADGFPDERGDSNKAGPAGTSLFG